MTPANHWKLGLFVITTLGLGFAALLFLGARQFDREVDTIYFFFNEPVDGLGLGSEVRFRGIPVGRVTDITIATDRTHVEVTAEVDVRTLVRLGIREGNEIVDRLLLKQRIDESGLRAYLERNALTGIAVINSDFFENHRDMPPTYDFEVPPDTIPTIPSTFKGLIADLEATLADLRKDLPTTLQAMRNLLVRLDEVLVDTKPGALARSLEETLKATTRAIEDIDARSLNENLARIADETHALVRSLNAPDGDFQRLLASYADLGENLEEQVESADLVGTARSARRAFDDTSQLAVTLESEVDRIVRALESIRRLVELLERNPGSVVRGRGAPRPVGPEGDE